jgi:hypothetical protein
MNNFILKTKIPDEVCDCMIKYFEDNTQLHNPGMLGGVIDTERKASTDVAIYDTEVVHNITVQNYANSLGNSLSEYVDKYHYSSEGQTPWGLSWPFNIQRYLPGEGYYQYHYENNGRTRSNLRHLAFITYLNSVKEGGGTEFYYQGSEYSPSKGDTLIFPAQWTHTHRGLVAPNETKYIATGWYTYYTEGHIL